MEEESVSDSAADGWEGDREETTFYVLIERQRAFSGAGTDQVRKSQNAVRCAEEMGWRCSPLFRAKLCC